MTEDAYAAALEQIDRAGGVAGPDHAPATRALMARARREHAVDWDDGAGRYVLTRIGRMHLARRGRPAQTAEVRPFRKPARR